MTKTAQEHRSARVTFTPDSTFCTLQLELLQGEFGTIGYLNTVRGNLPPTDKVTIAIGEKISIVDGIRLEGNQKMRLPDQATELIIDSLLEEKQIKIILQNYHVQVEPDSKHRHLVHRSKRFRDIF